MLKDTTLSFIDLEFYIDYIDATCFNKDAIAG